MNSTKFNAGKFNSEAFGYAVKRIGGLKINELVKAKALVSNPDIKNVFTAPAGAVMRRL